MMPLMSKLSESLHEVTLDLEGVGPFIVDFRESVCAPLFARGCYTHQLPEDRILDSILSPGMSVFDIGANIGYYTKFISHRIGPGGTVVAVEPMPRAVSLLKKNATGNVKVLPCAIGAAPGQAQIRERSELDVSFVKFGETVGRCVQVITIDSLSEVYGPPELIKIDVEGAELAAFDGARRTLCLDDPPIILFEYIAENTKEFSSYALADLLQRLGSAYRTFRIVSPCRLVENNATIDGSTNDYLAIPNHKVNAVLSAVR